MGKIFNMKISRGVTLVELLLVVFVAVILLTVIITPLSNFRDNKFLISAAEEVYSVLNEARSSTLTSKEDSQYGVHFESDKVVLFSGASYIANDDNNEETQVRNSVIVSSISLNGGGSDVLFQRLNGKTDNFGNITLQLIRNASSTRTINIEKTGVVTLTQ